MVKRILIVDDDERDLMSMESVLQSAGYEVVVVADGAKAFDKFTEESFSLVIIDIKMPTLSGYDLSRLIKGQSGNETKVVYCSIVSEREVDMEGVDGFIQKPFSSNSFLSKVKNIIK